MIISRTVPSFWETYHDLPDPVRNQAKKAFEIWKENPFHPSLRFKCVESKDHIWSLRISLGYRALCVFEDDTSTWFWVGNHQTYERLIKQVVRSR